MNNEIVSLKKICKVFSSTPQTTTNVIDNISFSIFENEFVSILGSSGCGKTTLLRIISGLTQPTTGIVEKYNNNREKNFLKFVFQEYNKSLFPWLTVYDNIAFGLNIEKKSKDFIDKEVNAMLSLIHLESYSKHYPNELSGGMQQRVAIARALICRPKLLLMDEPFGSLDALSRFDLENELLQLWKKFNLTIVFVTHDIDEAIYLSDRIILLDSSPAKITDDIKIDLPCPRDQIKTKNDRSFGVYRENIINKIRKR
jgi:NitT/TauT family transport system ATP-binding protein